MKHRTTVNANTNIHHLLWTRHDYNTGYCHSLRNLPYLRVPLDVKVHNSLHAEVPPIPVPSGLTAKRLCFAVLHGLVMGELTMYDLPSTRIGFLIDNLSSTDKKTFEALEKEYDFLERRGL